MKVKSMRAEPVEHACAEFCAGCSAGAAVACIGNLPKTDDGPIMRKYNLGLLDGNVRIRHSVDQENGNAGFRNRDFGGRVSQMYTARQPSVEEREFDAGPK